MCRRSAGAASQRCRKNRWGPRRRRRRSGSLAGRHPAGRPQVEAVAAPAWGPKKDQISRTRADACGRYEGPIFRGKPGGPPIFRAGRFPPYTASIPAAAIPRSPANLKGCWAFCCPLVFHVPPMGPSGVSSPERRAAGGWANPTPALRSPAPRATDARTLWSLRWSRDPSTPG